MIPEAFILKWHFWLDELLAKNFLWEVILLVSWSCYFFMGIAIRLIDMEVRKVMPGGNDGSKWRWKRWRGRRRRCWRLPRLPRQRQRSCDRISGLLPSRDVLICTIVRPPLSVHSSYCRQPHYPLVVTELSRDLTLPYRSSHSSTLFPDHRNFQYFINNTRLWRNEFSKCSCLHPEKNSLQLPESFCWIKGLHHWSIKKIEFFFWFFKYSPYIRKWYAVSYKSISKVKGQFSNCRSKGAH